MKTVGKITRGTADGGFLAVRISQSRHASLVDHENSEADKVVQAIKKSPTIMHGQGQSPISLLIILVVLLLGAGCADLSGPIDPDDTSITGRSSLHESALQPPAAIAWPPALPAVDNFVSPPITLRAASHGFPRLAIQVQACYPETEIVSLLQRIPWWDLAVVDIEIPRRLPGLFGPNHSLRRANPNLVTLAYFSTGDIIPNIRLPINTLFINGLSPSWFLRDTSGKKIPLFRLPDGNWTEALNMHSPLNEYLPDHLNNEYVQLDQTDGIFFDWAATNISWLNYRPGFHRSRIDINNDGMADPDDITDLLWTNGFSKMLSTARRIMPEKTMLVGNAGWNTGPAYLADLNGVMIEQFMEGAMIDNSKFGWAAIMRTYALALVYGRKPNFSFIMANSDLADDFAAMRFALTSTLLFDGYFCFTNRNNAYQRARWYDEYAVDHHTGQAVIDPRAKGYLGKPLGGAFNARHPAELLQKRILEGGNGLEDVLWRRNFSNGIVLVNPSRRTQHIKLGGTFRKIRGRTDPATNDGSELSSISLGAQRGIILLHPLP